MTPHEQIIGSTLLIQRFGSWPSFHDAEVIRFTLDRRGEGGPTTEMLVHTWAMTSEADARGYYVLKNHTLVHFIFERLIACDLSEFNQQNVLFGIEIEVENVDGESAFRVTLDSCFGLSGSLVCRRVVVAGVEPSDTQGQPAAEVV